MQLSLRSKMRFPLSWLQEFFPTTPLRPQEVAAALTQAGIEVEECTAAPLPFEEVYVAKVIDTTPHPQADRLKIARVTDGKKEYQVVCGAPNCRKGLLTAFVQVGGRVGETPIKHSKLRGVESEGMLCSARELGWGEDGDGIVEFPSSHPLGEDLATSYRDTLFDVSLTPNMGHAFSLLGLARELSAFLQIEWTYPYNDEEENPLETDSCSITIADPHHCSHYATLLIEGVEIRPSSESIQRRLTQCGIRPINTVVDATNLAMLELGQPLHAFDNSRLTGNQLVIRLASAGERLTTLDGQKRELSPEMLVIADGAGPIALAGVMGGEESQVTESTHSIRLEAATFAPPTIRKTAMEAGLSTESSRRFERGVDPNLPQRALKCCARYILTHAGGTLEKRKRVGHTTSPTHRRLSLRLSRIEQLLGSSFTAIEVEELLQRLHFVVVDITDAILFVEVPTFRFDITSEIDLIEEIARLYGFAPLTSPVPRQALSTRAHARDYVTKKGVRSRLVALGLHETLSCPIISLEDAQTFNFWKAPEALLAHLQNPHSEQHALLRPALLPSLLLVAQRNSRHGRAAFRLFEVGESFLFSEAGQVVETPRLALLMVGERFPPHWRRGEEEIDFFDGKGVLERLFSTYHLPSLKWERADHPSFAPGRSASLQLAGEEIGYAGELHPALLKKKHLEGRFFYAELSLAPLLSQEVERVQFAPLPLYPESVRDWTVALKREVSADQIIEAIWAQPSRLLKKVLLRAIYTDPASKGDLQNVTFRFIYRDDRKTLSDEAVTREQKRLQAGVEKAIGLS